MGIFIMGQRFKVFFLINFLFVGLKETDETKMIGKKIIIIIIIISQV